MCSKVFNYECVITFRLLIRKLTFLSLILPFCYHFSVVSVQCHFISVRITVDYLVIIIISFEGCKEFL